MKYEDVLKQGFIGKFDIETRELKDDVNVTFYYIYNGIPCKLFNIKQMKEDFNFHDIEADWIDEDKIKHGKFYLKDLIIK